MRVWPRRCVHVWEEPRRISLPREIQSRWQGLINVMSMSGLWSMILVVGCGPLLRVDDSLPGFTYIKGDPSFDTLRHSSPYFRASTGNHPAALDHADKTMRGLVSTRSAGGPSKINLTGGNLIILYLIVVCSAINYHQTDLLVTKLNRYSLSFTFFHRLLQFWRDQILCSRRYFANV